MPIEQLVTAVVETMINKALEMNPTSSRALSRLNGQCLQIHFKEFDRTLTLVFSSQQADVLAHYEGIADCRLSLSLTSLIDLQDKNQITRLIKQGTIDLEGDIELAQSFSQLMKESQPDIEEILSVYTGDIIAHSLVQSGKEGADWVKKRLHTHQKHVAEAVTQEWKMIPPALEIAYFCDQVDELHTRVEQCESKLTRLLEKL